MDAFLYLTKGLRYKYDLWLFFICAYRFFVVGYILIIMISFWGC